MIPRLDTPIRLPKLPKLGKPSFQAPRLGGLSGLSRRSSGADVCGLHIEPGEIIAAHARVNGGLCVDRAAIVELQPGLVRDGDVLDPEALGAALRELFADKRLPRRVRAGVASQRTVMRTIDLPPLDDPKDIAAAVRLHAPEHIAMPLDQALMDHLVLGRVDTPEGPRTRVVVAATDRESVDRLLDAMRHAGLKPVGVDLSAFALIRALHDPSAAKPDSVSDAVLYASIGGMTTVAIAEGAVCRFTRVSPTGLDAFAADLADRAGISLGDARDRLVRVGLEGITEDVMAREVLNSGVTALGDDLRTSFEYFATQWEKPVGEIVVTGPAAAVPGFASALERRVGVPVRLGVVESASELALGGVAPWRVSVAAGLSVEEVAA
jgi:type IV pilus assembly protein PilM